jgi:hypothetical protein
LRDLSFVRSRVCTTAPSGRYAAVFADALRRLWRRSAPGIRAAFLRPARLIKEALHRLEELHAVLFHDDRMRALGQHHEALAGDFTSALEETPSYDMGTHIDAPISLPDMKTTLEISDPLLREARKIAVRENTTLRELVEQGLRRVVAERKQEVVFKPRKATFKGRGLHPDLEGADWEKLRSLIYEGRGG